jgi:hypothetical protein
MDRRLEMELEKRSGYALPPTVKPGERDELPVKYTCFSVGDYLAIGRAVYLDSLDMTLRSGNYVCHSLLFDPSEVASLFDEPVTLIRSAEKAGMFLAEAFTDSVQLATETTFTETDSSPGALPEAAARAALAASFAWKRGDPPVLMVGSGSSMLDALASVLDTVPHSIRWMLPFDSYVFGSDPRGLAFAGLPRGHEYARGLALWSLRFDAESQEVEWRRPVIEDPIVSYLATLQGALGRTRDAAVSCIDLLEAENWEELVQNLRLVDQRGVTALYERYRQQILGRVGSASDRDLLEQVAPALSNADLAVLAASPACDVMAGAPGVRGRLLLSALQAQPSSPLLRCVAADADLTQEAVDRLSTVKDGRVRLSYLGALLRQGASAAGPDVEKVLLLAVAGATRAGKPGADSTGPVADTIRDLPQVGLAGVGWRLYALMMLGDKDALSKFVGAPGILTATFRDSPSVGAVMLRSAAAQRMKLDVAFGALVDDVVAEQLPSRVVTSACYDVFNDESLDDAAKRRFAKSLSAVLHRVPATQTWPARLMVPAEKYSSGGISGPRRKGI